jgi:adhesin HecA-like repeat protein
VIDGQEVFDISVQDRDLLPICRDIERPDQSWLPGKSAQDLASPRIDNGDGFISATGDYRFAVLRKCHRKGFKQKSFHRAA